MHRLSRPLVICSPPTSRAYWQSEIAYSLTVNNVFDTVGVKGEMLCTDVATALDLKVDFLCRMMSAGVGIKLLSLSDAGRYSLTPAGDMLRADHPGSLRAFMLMINEETKDAWRAAGTASLKTGVSGFKERYGVEFWDWHSEPSHTKQMAQFDGAMKSFSAEMSGSLLVDWQPPTPDAVVCDIGGGVGHMVAAMAEHYPSLKGVLFDLPPVAKRAAEALAEKGLSGRVSTLGGSFLESLPAELSRCDAFYLKFILHDWADEECVSILSAIKAVAKEGSQIVTTDFILGVDGANMEMSKRMMDINMMAANPPGAGERTWEEYAALFARAGFAKPSQLVKMRDLVSTVVTEV
jgi:predicted O-methyltransferase YrrM